MALPLPLSSFLRFACEVAAVAVEGRQKQQALEEQRWTPTTMTVTWMVRPTMLIVGLCADADGLGTTSGLILLVPHIKSSVVERKDELERFSKIYY